ncbi:fused ATPase and permease components of ABC transport system [Amycolatopsis mediterranei S699]|uniref:Fused ATPase and permease components of ABC transport system n=4 Tax=Amycolatopsis mediterranei TaxID=33910 RepID=A0A0H3D9B7_AMYMU|nr:thiol reductant ABC exporter subunit CydD [Amycolatopsis mediterranei]ADJ47236.1 fused ATPase and permease components of ABC transport system [Amycolatopsis mediterranei U32]AEK44060.1 fused ATPase and permease components of ABC transport system [Amycolatopsis mediterranei S699]AFO78947.1 fused ATPase and permease components of ABC transport system [Amycolatopsis mediterranei S699]AGT86075.1 fused ATPase and permease components of ABC transport system [Amycolatopsis mediterranei RB]KDO04802
MKPLDPRLLRHASAVRPFILACAALGVLTAMLVLAQAELLAKTITWAFLDGFPLHSLTLLLGMLLLVVLARAGITWLSETTAHRAAARALSQLRETVIAAALRIGPRQADRSPAEVAALATRGVDRLEGYFARYLPQLLIASVVPLVVGVRILLADWVAAVIAGFTVPLIPIFMILIGLYTQRDVRRQWKTLSVLGNHFLDLVAGLAELTAFGRARAQIRSLREITEKYRTQTLRTLRVAFLSALALELLATLSVAVVAVSIGLRLLAGELDLQTALVVLILAPEVYLPLRAVGARFHDSAEGLAAAEEIIALAGTPTGDTGTRTVPDLTRVALRCEDVTVEGRSGPILDGFSLRVPPGEVVGVTGPSGAGKSTLLDLLLGWRRPDGGRILIGDTDLADIGRATWHRRIAWVPQQPHLVAETVAGNIRLGSPDATDDEVLAAADTAALDVPLSTVVGELGAGLSTGQRRRVALARAVLLDRPLILLDEPTEGVDAETEAAILERLPKVLAGRTAVIVSHHPAVLARCDRVVSLGEPIAVPTPPAAVSPRPISRPEATPVVESSTVDVAKWRPLREAIRPHRLRLALACLAATAALGCGVALTATSSWLIASAALHPPVLSLLVAIVAVRTFGLAKGIFRYLERLLSHDVALRALAELRVRVWAQLVRIGPAGTARLRRGDLLHRLVSDVDNQQDVLVRGLVPGVSTFLVLSATVVTLGVILPGAGLAAAVGLAVAGGLAPVVAAMAGRRAQRETARLRADLTAGTAELLQASADLITHDAAAGRHARLRELDFAVTSLQRRSAAWRGLGGGIATLGVGLTSVACLALGILAVHAGTIPGPALAVLALVPLATAELVAGLPEAAQRLLGAAASARRLAGLDAVPAPHSVSADPAPAAVELAAERLSVRWPQATADAVQDVDLHIGHGRRLALTGRSGAGKSTVIAALMRYLDPSAGRILLDDTDTLTCDDDSVRERIAWCGPETHLFDSTLRENLRLARPSADDSDLRAALELAQLGPWLCRLPDGLDTTLGAHGTPVSGGERQRIGVARALLSDRPILLLDEPTAHLDAPTAAALAADVLAATEGRSALVVTHRPAEFAALPAVEVTAGRSVSAA